MIRIDVQSAHGPYPVLIANGLASRLREIARAHGVAGQAIVVSSPPIWRLHGRRVRNSGWGAPALIPDGERSKTLPTVARLYETFVRRGLARSSSVIAFGGGVVGDVAGFAAATFLRGVRLVQVPTTLLAQVDSAIGGKVGVNLAAGKNLAGAFHPPALVICDPELLATLPRREFRAGLYEVVKYGMIASRALFDSVNANLAALFAHDVAIITPIIVECCRIKAAVVGQDEREAGPRRVLNFGHTIGHALEAVTRYRRFRHGEAIAYGMQAAAAISVARGVLSADDQSRLTELIVHMGPLPVVTDLRVTDALEALRQDKKIIDGRLHYVIATGIGSTSIVPDVTESELRQGMKAIGMKP